jgi:hypothetical protein
MLKQDKLMSQSITIRTRSTELEQRLIQSAYQEPYLEIGYNFTYFHNLEEIGDGLYVEWQVSPARIQDLRIQRISE